MKTTLAMLILTLLALTAPEIRASGMLIPKDESITPLAIKHQRVDIQIKDGVATVTIEQVFKNHVDRDLEAVYVFPLPVDAAIADFAMVINGRRMSGELVERDKARRIYEDIVRRMKDPGLLEHMGGNLFKVSVYPVPRQGEQKIELSYSQTLPFASGVYRFTYPLKTGEAASRTLEDFSIRAQINTSLPLKTVYSPSHEVGISRKGEHEAVLGFEQDRALLDRDFTLFYGLSEKEFGLNLLTHSVDGQEGYFMMMLAPSVTPADGKVFRRDVAFVVDTSGSMAGTKIAQACEALKYCINRLNDGDRFALVRFSTDTDTLDDELLDATPANRERAIAFIETFEARGGTAIHEALHTALTLERADAGHRPYTIVFVTDGRPTIGETDVDIILEKMRDKASPLTRVFAFGVGHDVNTKLLDQMSSTQGGTTQYVHPDEDIEINISSFYDKISHPVLGTPCVSIDSVKTHMQHPQDLPDLFAGQQIIVLGRYRRDGHSAIRLTGLVNGEKREFVYEGVFPERNADNAFIPRLWATRRVGFLLDEIRRHGDAKELKDEVLALSKAYGIMTPYTSYLVLEDENAYQAQGIARDPAVQNETGVIGARISANAIGGEGASLSGARRQQNRNAAMSPVSRPAASSVPVFDRKAADSEAFRAEHREAFGQTRRTDSGDEDISTFFKKDSGMDAIRLSESINDYRSTEHESERIAPMVRHVEGRIFYKLADVWTDRDYRDEHEKIRLKYASDAYFAFLAKHPELKRCFALGTRVIVIVDGKAIVVE
ncbi:MAG: VIT domain-containing protein [Verrucomicrobia bacterium]|nr:VIT domain-containing protein [Verrucomicrobiota bacterium]